MPPDQYLCQVCGDQSNESYCSKCKKLAKKHDVTLKETEIVAAPGSKESRIMAFMREACK